MDHSLKTGVSFGLTSGVITTLGLMVGLHSSTHSKLIVIGGILVIAIADAFSDAMGIHISEESEERHSEKEIWISTAATFFSKFFVTASFIIPILLFPLSAAVIVNVAWGLLLIAGFSLYISRQEDVRSFWVVIEHILIALIVITITHYVGSVIRRIG
jgi:VIT1/CCC1 family predicted Fe2+/Mn2+ transporter